MKKPKSTLLFLFIALFLWLNTGITFSSGRPGRNFIDSLLQTMTIDEKIGQLIQIDFSAVGKEKAIEYILKYNVGSFLNVWTPKEIKLLQETALKQTRSGIPLIFGLDVIHGYRTIFPIPLAESCSWNPKLVEKSARMAAIEASAHGIHWTFAPMVDIARDARWGRIAEGAGEDTYLGCVMAEARVRGFQGNDLSNPTTIVACPKHYVAYGACEGGKDYNTVDISPATLYQVYLPPFAAAINAGALTVMSAFNEINGIPASANEYTLREILKKRWGFKGFVVSDYNAVAELVIHGFVPDKQNAALKAITAGVDMEMMGFSYLKNLKTLTESGKLPVAMVDSAVKRILYVKYKLGLFKNPIYGNEERRKNETLKSEFINHARTIARESIVLLKNKNKLLPLDESSFPVALIGPLAASKKDLLGSWSCAGKPEDVISILEALETRIGSKNILYAKGCEIERWSEKDLKKALRVAKKAKTIILVLGETREMSGEGGSRAYIGLTESQLKLAKAITRLKKPVVVVLVNGRPLAIPWIAQNIPAIIESWQLGIQHGPAVVDVLFGDCNPSGKLAVSFPKATGQEPLYYNHKMTGRPPIKPGNRFESKYIDLQPGPLFPFGYGLSYSKFVYSELKIYPKVLRPTDTLLVTVKITNDSDIPGKEIVQLYIRDVSASLTRPVKELKNFKKVYIRPHEHKIVTFRLPVSTCGFYNSKMEWKVEPGKFKLWVGPSSAEGLTGEFEIK